MHLLLSECFLTKHVLLENLAGGALAFHCMMSAVAKLVAAKQQIWSARLLDVCGVLHEKPFEDWHVLLKCGTSVQG